MAIEPKLTREFESELKAKIDAAGLSLPEVIMLGYATGRTPNDFCDLFAALLNRVLTEEEQCVLGNLEGEQYLHVENIIGPLEATACA